VAFLSKVKRSFMLQMEGITHTGKESRDLSVGCAIEQAAEKA